MLRPFAALLGSGFAWAGLLGMCGCGAKQHAPAAAASRRAYTDSQGVEARAAMQSVLAGVTNTGPPIALLPSDGIRWDDLPQAISEAGANGAVEVAVAGQTQLGVATRFELLTIEGWPGVLQAARLNDGIVLGASIGPYPNQPAARARAARLVELTHERLQALGRVPQVTPYAVR